MLPDGVAYGAAAMLEPMAVAVRAMRMAQTEMGQMTGTMFYGGWRKDVFIQSC